MKKEDLKEIAELVTTVVDSRFGQFKEEIYAENQRVQGEMAGENKRFKSDIIEEFRHQLGLQREDFPIKLDIVVEGHQMLNYKIDQLDEGLSGKLDAVADDLKEHRRDTEAHKGGYKAMDE